MRKAAHGPIATSGITGVLVCKPTPIVEGNERPKKEAGHWRLTVGRFKKQGNLYSSLVLGSQKTKISVPFPFLPSILKLYIEALMVSFIYTVQMVSTTHCTLKAASLKMTPTEGTVGRSSFQGPGREWRICDFPGSDRGSTCSLHASLQHMAYLTRCSSSNLLSKIKFISKRLCIYSFTSNACEFIVLQILVISLCVCVCVSELDDYEIPWICIVFVKSLSHNQLFITP